MILHIAKGVLAKKIDDDNPVIGVYTSFESISNTHTSNFKLTVINEKLSNAFASILHTFYD